MPKQAVIWVNWGRSQENLLQRSIDSVELNVPADLHLITDTWLNLRGPLQIRQIAYKERGFTRKPEALLRALPPGYETYLFLDADTVVLGDVTLGFEKAALFDIALAPAPTYSLDTYHRTGEIMSRESIPQAGQLLYNSGVIFFSSKIVEKGLFHEWLELCQKYSEAMRGDQEMLTLAMEMAAVNPYTLSKSYNTRGRFEPIIGSTRIWHQRSDVPRTLNYGSPGYPPRMLARGRLIKLRLKDTYGGGFRFLVANASLIKRPRNWKWLVKELFQSRNLA